jgi:ABC-2 type transport system ATP-binding protein
VVHRTVRRRRTTLRREGAHDPERSGLGHRGQRRPQLAVDCRRPGLGVSTRFATTATTWSPGTRGEFDSGGVLQLDSPFFEAREVSAIIDFVETQPTTKFEDQQPTDPLIGMVDGSYGSGIQWVTAATDD